MNFTFKGAKKGSDLELYFEKDEYDGSVYLIAKIDDDREDCIMSFSDGRFYRMDGIQLNGIETDSKGRIKEIE